MTSNVTSAGIAAVVSFVVPLATGTATYLTTRASWRRDHDRQQADLRRSMTARLYDRRMAVYPGLFAATEACRMSRLDGTQDVRAHVRDGLTQVEQWGALEGALILSDVAYARFLE